MPGPMSEAWPGPQWVQDLVADMAGEDLAAYIGQEQLGPVTAIAVDGIPVQLELDPAYLSKAHVLTRWVDHLEGAEPIVHRYPRTAPRIRVNLRGLLGDVNVVVYAVYEQEREPRQFALLAQLHSQPGSVELHTLLAGLAALEPQP